MAKFKLKLPNKKTIIIVIMVIVIATAAGVGSSWVINWVRSSAPSQPQTLPPEVIDAQNQLFEGNYDKAHETVNDALKNPDLSVQSKYDLLMQQAYTYEGQKNYQAALSSFRQAEATLSDMGVAQSIARLATEMDNKDLAIAYYQKALTLIPDDNPMRDEHRKYFKSMISVLQGGQPNYE